MKYLLWVCIVTSVAVIPAFAQGPVSVEVGAYGGVPLSHTLEPTFCCTTAAAFFGYETQDASYTTGVSAGVVLHDRIHVSFGAMYMPVLFRSVGTTCCPLTHPVATTHGTSWEFPLLGDYRWLRGAVRPFSGGGLVLHNRISGGDEQGLAPVVSGGVEFLLGRSFVVRPEFRYTHYAEEYGSNNSVGRPSPQTQFLIGVVYRSMSITPRKRGGV
jgi:hypothetical protein